jgi:hypothetical protein
MSIRNVAAAAAILLTGVSVAGAASAAPWAVRHPRRAEVNYRTYRQDWRIRQGVRDGQLTHQQARTLRGEDRGIRAEQRAEARANGGYITRGEQRSLNRQENAESREIYNERHD